MVSTRVGASRASAEPPARNSSPRAGILLDRDGTIIADHGYVGSVDRVEFIEGSPEAIASFNRANIPVAVVTNQAGVARGMYGIDDVARVHFALGARLRLGWLRARIAELPRGDRWQIEARAGLRDDVADLHRALTEAVLATTPTDADASARVEAWITRNADAAARAEGVLTDIETVGTYDLATLGTARRELRDLVDLSRSA